MISKATEESLLWRIKLRLQFTGWLQFMPTAVLMLVCCALAGVGGLIGNEPALLVWPPAILGALLLLMLLFEVAALKFGLRPAESLPARKDGVDAFELMLSRRSCRSFQARDLTPADRDELMACVQRQTQSAALIGERPIRLEYVAAPLTVWPVLGAREFLVAIAPHEYDRLSVIDVGRSLQKVVLHGTRMGLATCWIGPGADQRSVERHLGERFDPTQDHIICVCAIGYESWIKPLPIRVMQLAQHRRLPLSSLFFADPQLQVPLDVEAPPFRRFGRCYEVCRWSPSSYNAQPTRCAAAMRQADGDTQLERFDFFATTASRYYAAVALGIWCANWECGCEALGIAGHFAVLSADARGVHDAPELPHYDVSWNLCMPRLTTRCRT